MKKSISAIALLFMGSVAFADQAYVTAAPTAPAGSSAMAPTAAPSTAAIPSKDFLKQMAQNMVTSACDPKSALLANFKLTQADCQSKVSTASAACEQQILPTMPATILTTQASQWGQTFGKCVGEGFAESVKAAPTTAATPTPVSH